MPGSASRRLMSPTGRPFLFGVAACMAMGALSIDMLLPGFPELREEVGLPVGSTDIAQVLTSFFIGIAVGQLVFGPLSDRYGRRPVLQVGLVVMLVGAAATTFTSSLTAMVICRFIWGFGAAAPRALALAMVRDRFEGDRMARTMSMLMTIFLIVPVVAPGLGSVVLAVGDWRLLIGAQAALVAATLAWSFWFPETLAEDRRRSVGPRALAAAARDVVTNRAAVCFGLAATVLFGALTTYIGSAEVMFDEVFGAKDQFPVLFGAVAAFMAVGSLLSARLVGRLGLAGVLKLGAGYTVLVATALALVAWMTDGRPALWAFVVVLCCLFPGIALVLPNCNTAAMQPLGHVAGAGAAVLGMVSSGGGALLGMVVDDRFDGTITPFATGVFVFCVVTGLLIVLGGRPRPVVVHDPEVELLQPVEVV